MTIGRTLMGLWRCAIHGGTWSPTSRWTTQEIREFMQEIADLDAADLAHLRTDLKRVVEHEERAEYERLKAKYG